MPVRAWLVFAMRASPGFRSMPSGARLTCQRRLRRPAYGHAFARAHGSGEGWGSESGVWCTSTRASATSTVALGFERERGLE
eukprot:15349826-Alexandrium_andersonii.AAC.1